MTDGSKKVSKSLKIVDDANQEDMSISTLLEAKLYDKKVILKDSNNVSPTKVNVNSEDIVMPLSIELRPFKNKVGGHSAIFKFNKKSVCKELINDEHLMYELIEEKYPQLLEFLAKYIGILNVRYSTMAETLDIIDNFEILIKDNIHLIPSWFINKYGGTIDDRSKKDDGTEPSYHGKTSVNEKFHEEIVEDLISNSKFTPVTNYSHKERFLLLEDLTCDMAKPCIIDIKMGSRQYGIDANKEKITSQKLKCKNTTSLKLGIRLCGLQIYNNVTKKFFILDKYYGRSISLTGAFINELIKFLNNSDSLYDILTKIPIILNKLIKLFNLLNTMNYYRFYGSSILIIYDGENMSDVKVKMIDFAKSFIVNKYNFLNMKGENLPNLNHGKDYGHLKGLNNLIKCFKIIFETLSGIKIDKFNELNLQSIVKSKQSEFLKPFSCNMIDDLSLDLDLDYEYDDYVSE